MTEEEAKKAATLTKAVDEARAEWEMARIAIKRASGDRHGWIEVSFKYNDDHRCETWQKQYFPRADFVALLQVQEIAARRNLEQARAMLAGFNP